MLGDERTDLGRKREREKERKREREKERKRESEKETIYRTKHNFEAEAKRVPQMK
jgi:hypothetical protein